MSEQSSFDQETRRENTSLGREVLKNAEKGDDGVYRYEDKTGEEWMDEASSREAVTGGGVNAMETEETISDVLAKLNSGELSQE